MKKHSGYAHFPTAFLTFSVLLLVLAAGFVIGRVVVAGAYRDAAPEFEKLPTAEAPAEVEPEPQATLAPGSVHVPPPTDAPAESVPAEAPEEAAPDTGQPETPSDQGPLPSPPPATTRMPAPPPPQPRHEPAPLVPEAPPTSARGYTIQVGLFTSQEGARQVADDLTRAGHPARIIVERSEVATLYRVLTGQYRTEYAARSAVDQLRQQGFPAFLLQQ